MRSAVLLQARALSFDTPAGRPLFRELGMTLAAGEHVAVVGRNGAGKSTLLDVLAGDLAPRSGLVVCNGRRCRVPQRLPVDRNVAGELSPGETRKRALRQAFAAEPDFLLLDEPTHDLDADGIDWLVERLTSWEGGLLVVSHDRRVLRLFGDFFVVAEAGCRHFSGRFDALLEDMTRETEERQERYVRGLNRLLQKEKDSATDRRRRQRKKNLGRLHEVKRCPSRIKLNSKRSYAQVKQGKRQVRRDSRLGAAREWARATRRALSVELSLRMAVPEFPAATERPIAMLECVGARAGGRSLFADLSLRLSRQRLGITGPNGSGKTVLVQILTGERPPEEGRAVSDPARIGYVAQNTGNWCVESSVIEYLCPDAVVSEHAAQLLRAHKFPFALAQRPLSSLSPGERLRAALICLWQRRPVPELLVLDEPTSHLDFVGIAALESVLSAWPGGLVVVSHDDEFLEAIGVDRRLCLGR